MPDRLRFARRGHFVHPGLSTSLKIPALLLEEAFPCGIYARPALTYSETLAYTYTQTSA